LQIRIFKLLKNNNNYNKKFKIIKNNNLKNLVNSHLKLIN